MVRETDVLEAARAEIETADIRKGNTAKDTRLSFLILDNTFTSISLNDCRILSCLRFFLLVTAWAWFFEQKRS